MKSGTPTKSSNQYDPCVMRASIISKKVVGPQSKVSPPVVFVFESSTSAVPITEAPPKAEVATGDTTALATPTELATAPNVAAFFRL